MLLPALLLGLALPPCSPPRDQKEQVAQQKKDELRRKILAMAARHSADLEWMRTFDKGEFYTIELQEALLHPEKRPRLLLASIADVMKREDAYFLTAHDWLSGIYFQLECSAEHSKYVLTSGTDDMRMFQEYAIVMLPSSVQMPVAQLVAEIDGDVPQVVHEAPSIRVVRGTCLDLLSLEDSLLSAEDLIEPKSEQSK